MKNSGIVANGESNLRKAIEAEVRRDYAQELASAKGFFARLTVKEKIRNEVKKRLGKVISPHALYSSHRPAIFSRE
jgi:hypothetical protein